MSDSSSPRPKNEDSSNQGNNLFISNLSYKTQEKDLHEKFSVFGKITNCKVIKDPYTNESRGFGFVTFESSEDASEARSRLAGLTIDGRELRIEVAKRSKAYSPTPGNYLGNPRYKRSDHRSPRRRSPERRHKSPRRSPRRKYESPRRSSPRRSSNRRRSPKRYSRSRS